MSTIPFQKTELIDNTRLARLLTDLTLPNTIKTALQQIKSKAVSCNGVIQSKVQYVFSRNMKDLNDGRIYAQGTHLQGLKKDVRNYLASPFYEDVDMVNALPSITWNLATRFNMDCPPLSRYIADRDQMLKEWGCNKQDVLKAFLKKTRKDDNLTQINEIHTFLYGPFVLKLRDEYPALFKNIEMRNEGDFNVDGKFISAVCFAVEGDILLCMEKFFKQQELQLDVYMFDGCMLLKDEAIDNDLLDDCTSYVKKMLDYDIKLAVKPMTSIYDTYAFNDVKIPDNSEPEKKVMSSDVAENEKFSLKKLEKIFDEKKNWDGAIKYLNNFWCKVKNGQTVVFCNRDTISSPWIWRKYSEFRSAHEHLNFTYVYERKSCVFDALDWRKDSNMNVFDLMVFDPSYVGEKGKDELNLFRGFKAKPRKSFDLKIIQPLLDHNLKVVNNGNAQHATYLIKWMAHIIQRPHVKTGVCPVSFGSPGSGKNTFFEFFGKMVIGNDHYCYINDIDQFAGKFNSFLGLALFVILDEVTFAGGHKVPNKIKSLITQSRQLIEKKGIDAIQCDSFLNCAALSNNDDAVKIERGDRRFFVKRSGNSALGDDKYFTNLRKVMGDPLVADHFITYLYSIDVSDFVVGQALSTPEKEDMKIFAMRPVELFASELMAGNIRDEMDVYFQAGNTYQTTMTDLFKIYNNFIKDNDGGGDKVTIKGFGKLVRQCLCIKNITTNRNGGTPIDLILKKPDQCRFHPY